MSAWEQRKLGENVIIKSGWSPSNFVKTGSEESELFIKVNDLNYSSREQNDSQMRVHDNPRYQKMKKGSIIFPKRGAAIMTNKVRILGSDGYMDTNMMALEPQKIDGHFLYTFITRTGLYKIADTSTIPQINNKHIEPYIIYCPSVEEQTKVGAFFKKLDKTIALHQRKLTLLKQIKQTYLYALFPQNDEHIPVLRFSTFFGSWEQRKLGQLAEFNPKSSLPDEFEYVDLESVVGTEMIFHRTETKINAPSRAQRLAIQGDVFYQTVRPYQKNNFLFDWPYNNYVFSTGYAQLRPLGDSYFLFSRLQEEKFISKVLERSTGTSYPAINSKDLAQIKVGVPLVVEEQTKIGNFFKNLDKTIALHQCKLEKLVDLKDVLLGKLFL